MAKTTTLVIIGIALILIVGLILLTTTDSTFDIDGETPPIIDTIDLSVYTQYPEITFEEAFGDQSYCFSASCLSEGCVIGSQETFDDLIEYSGFRGCELVDFASVDFDTQTLLGKVARGSGCSREFIKHVYQDDENQRVIYTIEVVENGFCEPLETNNNWILTPQLPEDYNVEFVVKCGHVGNCG